MKNNSLKKLEVLGQSIWLDYIRRDLITSGELRHMIEEDGIKGMTSNPSIFEKAIVESPIYDQNIHDLAIKKKDVKAIYESISQSDVQNAADEFRHVYDKTDGKDGYVSLEVNPHLAHNTKGTIEEARRLWTALNRPNVFIKVPATSEGLIVIRQLISEGINVNVTLLFGLPRYRQVAEACIAGLESRMDQGKPLNHIASVASFFLSRIDTLVDPMVEKFLASGSKEKEIANKVHGQVAISSAKVAYQIYKEIFEGSRFKKLANKGAHVQRLLWASTSNKNPAYSDIKYIEPIIGRDTINTVPLETIYDYLDHGDPKSLLEQNIKEANWVMARLPELGININEVTQQLEDEGIRKFDEPFDKLMETLTKKSALAIKAINSD
jgi:transaldolase